MINVIERGEVIFPFRNDIGESLTKNNGIAELLSHCLCSFKSREGQGVTSAGDKISKEREAGK